jgi:stress-induced morphogen
MFTLTENHILTALESLETDIKVVDQSHKHANHYIGQKNGLTHIRLHIKKSTLFLNLTKVQQHQKVYALLNTFIEQGLHAIEIIIED